jgi:hypothetical protein
VYLLNLFRIHAELLREITVGWYDLDVKNGRMAPCGGSSTSTRMQQVGESGSIIFNGEGRDGFVLSEIGQEARSGSQGACPMQARSVRTPKTLFEKPGYLGRLVSIKCII